MISALSFDVEEYFHAAALKNAFGGAPWTSLPSRVCSATERILDLLDENGARGTFFVLGWVAERQRELVRQIQRRGHEVACHGYSHSLVYGQSIAEFREETLRAKCLLEDIVGVPVEGYRAASFSVTRKSLWALDVLADVGFRYDSSIFPIFHDRYGIPGAPRHPHRLVLSGGQRLLEFPPSTVRYGLMTLPVGGGGYFRLLPYSYTSSMVKRLVLRERVPLMFYLHPWDIDSGQPVGQVSALTRVRHYFNINRCADRLIRLLREFRFGTVRESLSAAKGWRCHQDAMSCARHRVMPLYESLIGGQSRDRLHHLMRRHRLNRISIKTVNCTV
jgi:polysaccharide deacetylase family protein (PEP-CTERM system associated)